MTAKRAERVRFARPFYALEGGRLFAPPAALFGLEAGVTGVAVCLQNGSYLEPALSEAGAKVVETTSSLDYAPAIADGRCAAGATDDFAPHAAGLEVVLGLPLLSPAPYAVALSKDAAADDLALRVSGALVALLTGPDAPLVAAQRRAFAAIGVAPSPAVAQLSSALTTMDACASGEAAEGAALPPAAAARRRGLAAADAAVAAASAADGPRPRLRIGAGNETTAPYFYAAADPSGVAA